MSERTEILLIACGPVTVVRWLDYALSKRPTLLDAVVSTIAFVAILALSEYALRRQGQGDKG